MLKFEIAGAPSEYRFQMSTRKQMATMVNTHPDNLIFSDFKT